MGVVALAALEAVAACRLEAWVPWGLVALKPWRLRGLGGLGGQQALGACRPWGPAGFESLEALWALSMECFCDAEEKGSDRMHVCLPGPMQLSGCLGRATPLHNMQHAKHNTPNAQHTCNFNITGTQHHALHH